MIDKTDKKLIEVLRVDASLSLKEISKITDLRMSTAHQRIKKLKEKNVIRYTVITDDEVVGENLVVFMMVQTDGLIDDAAFKDSHIKEVFGVTGEYDLILKMKFRDVKEFNNFIISFREKHQLKKTLTMVGTVKIKD